MKLRADVLRDRAVGQGVGSHYLFHAGRAELLRELGQSGQAQAADRRALELTANPAEQALLRQRILEASCPRPPA